MDRDAVINLPNGLHTTISHVYYVPGLKKNLISVSELTDNGIIIKFVREGCHISALNKDGQYVTLLVPKTGRLYPLGDSSPAHASASSIKTQENTLKWYYRLGHISQHVLHQLTHRQLALGLPKHLTHVTRCEGCILAKAHHVPFPTSLSRATAPLDLIHSDVCGPLPVNSLTGNKYMLTFIDDFSKYTTTYYMAEKSSTFSHFCTFKALVETKHGCHIKTLCTDHGGEYTSHAFKDLCLSAGIRHELSITDHPQ
ncbi:hypothetical protein GOP47_0002225 [Adiantum capillus-veneris]|uniref:Integrase catalytic domain-containing protein n=1 Tax=Adiantum capillus-veneris TaxID=13818 RepID=A0A9D4VBP5_ADICA|nr:hypothetical protein GOP47_0002225 [Adiantum capillus-veneris]